MNILIVEDEKDSVRSMVKFLQNRGYNVVYALSGEEALGLLRKEKIDLAIIDILLPDINGYELCATIRHNKRLKNLPIIISTGMNNESTKDTSKDIGVNEFLGKPYTTEDLLSAIKRCSQKVA